MSQHYFKTPYQGYETTVILGWDRRLQYYFMVIPTPIERLKAVEPDHDETCEGCDECSEMIYSNLYEPNGLALSLDHYREVLSKLGITVPESLFTEVQRDAQTDAGNRTVTHTADGRLIEYSPG